MIYAFTYNYDSDIRDGALMASSIDDAHRKLSKIGIKPLKVTMDVVLSLKILLTESYNYKDLCRLYNTIGNRILLGKGVIEGLETSGEFIFDRRLKFAVLSMASQLKAGDKIYESMLKAGFTKIDAMVIRSSESSGNQGDAFVRLAKEIQRRNEISDSIKNIFFMPAITLFLIYIGCFLAPYAFGINTEKQLKSLDIQTSDFANYFEIAHFSHDHSTFYIMLAILPLIGIFFLFKKRYIAQWLDHWKLWRNISIKSDMVNTWTAFAQLWESGVTPTVCAELVMEACEREDSRIAFYKLQRGLSSGKNISVSTQNADFIPIVKKGIRAADDGASMSFPEGVISLTNELAADVIAMVQLLKAYLSVASILVGGLGALFFIYVALGPMYLTALKNL